MVHIFQVYRIDKSMKGNHFNTGREEKWKVVKDKKFDKEEEAQDYVFRMNRHYHAIDLQLHNLQDKDEIRNRCLNDENFMHRRTYFLQVPDLEKIRQLLSNDGITVYRDKTDGSPKKSMMHTLWCI